MREGSLSAAFLARVQARSDAGPALEAELNAMVAGARADWPGVDVPGPEFCAYLGERATGSPGELRTSELYLACACARGDNTALAVFEAQYLAEVPAFVAHLRLPHDRLEELQQNLRRELFVADQRPPKIASYSGRGALGGWLRVYATRAAVKLLRHQVCLEEDAQLTEHAALNDDPELGFLKQADQAIFRRAFGEALSTLPVQRQLYLRQHHIDGLSMDELATLHRVPRSSVARWIAEAREQILRETKKRLRKDAGLSDSECQSVLRQVQSRFDRTFSSLFKA
jgi:RNA polymerase sigma-70 factor (ECF subfamily)